MTKKKHQVVWHKKKGKFVSLSYLKPSKKGKPASPAPAETDASRDKLRRFARKFGEQIKTAAREPR